MLLARFPISEPFELAIIHCSAESRVAREMHSHHGGAGQGKPRLSQGNSILTLIIIFLLLSPPLFSFLSCVQSSLLLSYSPLADSLTGFVPLANHSALIMRIISSHRSPRCASSISSGLFAHHQTLPISPFICVRVCLWPDARHAAFMHHGHANQTYSASTN